MIKRELYLAKIRCFYHSELVKILVGIRHCGKSVILSQIADELRTQGVDESHIIFLDFEDYDNLRYTDPGELNSYIKQQITDGKLYYLFLMKYKMSKILKKL